MDVTHIVGDLQFDLAIGNGCGQFGQEGYRRCVSDHLDLNGHQLDIMWIELEIRDFIYDNGALMDLDDLLNDERIRLICDPSPTYLFESTIIINVTLGIDDDPEIEDLTPRIFPNAFNKRFTIKNAQGSSLECYNINGRKIFQVDHLENNAEIITFNYQSGIYILLFKFDNGSSKTIKIIKY